MTQSFQDWKPKVGCFKVRSAGFTGLKPAEAGTPNRRSFFDGNCGTPGYCKLIVHLPMKRFFTTALLSILLGVSLTAVSSTFFKSGVDYRRRGVPLWWIETRGAGLFRPEPMSYSINPGHLVADVLVWVGISWALLGVVRMKRER